MDSFVSEQIFIKYMVINYQTSPISKNLEQASSNRGRFLFFRNHFLSSTIPASLPFSMPSIIGWWKIRSPLISWINCHELKSAMHDEVRFNILFQKKRERERNKNDRHFFYLEKKIWMIEKSYICRYTVDWTQCLPADAGPKNWHFLMLVFITQFASTLDITPMRHSDPFHAIESFGSLVSFGFKKRVQNAGTSTSDRDIKLTPLN